MRRNRRIGSTLALGGALLLALGASSAGARPAAATRLDPYKSYRFRLQMDGRTVAGFGGMHGALAKAPEVVKHREGGDPGAARKSPGRNKFESVTLERGLTQDSNFQGWVAGASASHDLQVSEAGGARRSLSHCSVVRHSKLPTLGGGGNQSIEELHLSCERVSLGH